MNITNKIGFIRIGVLAWILFTIALGQLLAQVNPTNHYFESDELQLRYIDEGKGEPVVLIHGLTSSVEDWIRNDMVSTLNRAGFRTIAYDTRGHGLSDKPHDPEKYGAPEVDDLVHLLDHLEISRVHIVGYSHGSALAMGFLAKYPERIRSVTFGGYGFDGRTLGSIEVLQSAGVTNALAQGDVEPFIRAMSPPGQPLPDQEHMAMIRHNFLTLNDNMALAACLAGMAGIPKVTPEQLKANTIPTIAVVGEADWSFRDMVDKMSAVTGSFEALVIPGADHLSAFMRPEFPTSVLAFLNKNSED